jgi:hypothetical protein
MSVKILNQDRRKAKQLIKQLGCTLERTKAYNEQQRQSMPRWEIMFPEDKSFDGCNSYLCRDYADIIERLEPIVRYGFEPSIE